MNSSAELVDEVPPGEVTVMFTVPACPGGDMAWISVEDTMLKDVAAMLPKNT